MMNHCRPNKLTSSLLSRRK